MKDSFVWFIDMGEVLFDFIFIDVDKDNNVVYFDVVLKLLWFGMVIVVDNVVCNGCVVDLDNCELDVVGVCVGFVWFVVELVFMMIVV